MKERGKKPTAIRTAAQPYYFEIIKNNRFVKHLGKIVLAKDQGRVLDAGEQGRPKA